MAVSTLYDYFNSIGQPLPSVSERRSMYDLGDDYMGTAAQNTQLLQRLLGGQTATATPTYTDSGAEVGTVMPSGGGGSLFDQYQARLNPINHNLESLYNDYLMTAAGLPTFKQRLEDEIRASAAYPTNAELRAQYLENPNLTPIAVEALVSRQGTSTRGTVQDIIDRAYSGVESDLAARKAAAELAQQQRDNLIEEYGLEYESQQDALDRTSGYGGSGGTVTERLLASTRNAAIADAKNGMKPKDLAIKYAGSLDDWELMNIYNQNSPSGDTITDPEQFRRWASGDTSGGSSGLDQAAIDAYVEALVNGEIQLNNVPADYRDVVAAAAAKVAKAVQEGRYGRPVSELSSGGSNIFSRTTNVLGSLLDRLF